MPESTAYATQGNGRPPAPSELAQQLPGEAAPRHITHARPVTSVPQADADQPSLEALLQALGPLVEAYFKHQETLQSHERETQQRELEFDQKALAADAKRDGLLAVSATVVVVTILGLSGALIFTGQPAAAVDLIKLIATIVTVAFGGYGLAASRSRRRPAEERDE